MVFVLVFGILIALYCCTNSKKTPSDSSHDRFDYSYADDQSLTQKEEEIEEEHETTFDDINDYQPPEITPVVKNDDSTSEN